MTTVESTLTLMGAAEGSYYTVGGASKDVRYTPSFANDKSGLSFGIFQFDVATNPQAQGVLQAILTQAVTANTIDPATSDRLYAGAAARNAKAHLKADDVTKIANLFGTATARQLIDDADKTRATTVALLIDGIISEAAKVWAMKALPAPVLTPGGVGNLRLFAYLLASWNRYPANQKTFEDWLAGKTVKTANGPHDGFQLAKPPTIDEMHIFFKSLRIWDGTQGNYQYLRDRLDPVLTRLTA